MSDRIPVALDYNPEFDSLCWRRVDDGSWLVNPEGQPIHYTCPKCKKGLVRFCGFNKNKCDHCDFEQTQANVYYESDPMIDYDFSQRVQWILDEGASLFCLKPELELQWEDWEPSALACSPLPSLEDIEELNRIGLKAQLEKWNDINTKENETMTNYEAALKWKEENRQNLDMIKNFRDICCDRYVRCQCKGCPLARWSSNGEGLNYDCLYEVGTFEEVMACANGQVHEEKDRLEDELNMERGELAEIKSSLRSLLERLENIGK